MVTGFALTGQKMNSVLADTWSTKNKAVVMEGNYPNLAPYHITIKPNHIKTSPLVSWHMFNKNMLFLPEDRLVSGWRSWTGLLTHRGGMSCLTWPRAGTRSFRSFSSLPLKLKESHCWSERATRSYTFRTGTLMAGIVILTPICCYVVLLIERITRSLRQI